MKAEDLMIGDWVFYYAGYDKEESINSPIRAIGTQYTDEMPVFLKFCGSDTYGENEIFPLMLTKEVLERNGWHNYTTYGKWSNNRVDLELQECLDGGYSVEVPADEYGTATFGYIKYVHELQHLYRVLGYKQDWLIEQTDEPDWSLIEK